MLRASSHARAQVHRVTQRASAAVLTPVSRHSSLSVERTGHVRAASSAGWITAPVAAVRRWLAPEAPAGAQNEAPAHVVTPAARSAARSVAAAAAVTAPSIPASVGPLPPPPAPTPSMLEELARRTPGTSSYQSFVYDASPESATPYRLWWLDPEGSVYASVMAVAKQSASLLEALHDASHLPWWTTIILAGALVRIAVLPATMYSLRNASRAADARTDMTAVQRAYHRARTAAGTDIAPAERIRLAVLLQRGMRAALEKAHCYPLRSLAMPFLQVPIIIAGVLGARHCVLLGDQRFEQEGALWFQDLTVPDSTYLLPMASISLAYLSLEVMFGRGKQAKVTSGGASLLGADVGNTVKSALQMGILLTSPFLAELPAGLYLLMTANSAWTIAYLRAVRTPSIYKAITGRELPSAPPAGLAASSLGARVMYPDLTFPGIDLNVNASTFGAGGAPPAPAAVAPATSAASSGSASSSPSLVPAAGARTRTREHAHVDASTPDAAAAGDDAATVQARTVSEHTVTVLVPPPHGRTGAALAAPFASASTSRNAQVRPMHVQIAKTAAARAASFTPPSLLNGSGSVPLPVPTDAAQTSSQYRFVLNQQRMSPEELRMLLTLPRLARLEEGSATTSSDVAAAALATADLQFAHAAQHMNRDMPMLLGHPNPFLLRVAAGAADSPLNVLRTMPRPKALTEALDTAASAPAEQSAAGVLQAVLRHVTAAAGLAAPPAAPASAPPTAQESGLEAEASRRLALSLILPLPRKRGDLKKKQDAPPLPAMPAHGAPSAATTALTAYAASAVDYVRVYGPGVGTAPYGLSTPLPAGIASVHGPAADTPYPAHTVLFTTASRQLELRVITWNAMLDALEGLLPAYGALPPPVYLSQRSGPVNSGAPPSAGGGGGASSAGGAGGGDGGGGRKRNPHALAAARTPDEAGSESEVDLAAEPQAPHLSPAAVASAAAASSDSSLSDGNASTTDVVASSNSAASSGDSDAPGASRALSRRDARLQAVSARRRRQRAEATSSSDDGAAMQNGSSGPAPSAMDSLASLPQDATSARVSQMLSVNSLPRASRRHVRKWTRMMRPTPGTGAQSASVAHAASTVGEGRQSRAAMTSEELLGYKLSDEIVKLAFAATPPLDAVLAGGSRIDADTWKLLLGPDAPGASASVESELEMVDVAAQAAAANVALHATGAPTPTSAIGRRRRSTSRARDGTGSSSSDEASSSRRILRGILLEDGTFIPADAASVARDDATDNTNRAHRVRLSHQDRPAQEAQVMSEAGVAAHAATEDEVGVVVDETPSVAASMQRSAQDVDEVVEAGILSSGAYQPAGRGVRPVKTDALVRVPALAAPPRPLTLQQRREHVLSALAMLHSPEYTAPGRLDPRTAVQTGDRVDEDMNLEMGFGTLIGHGAAAVMRQQHPRAAELAEQEAAAENEHATPKHSTRYDILRNMAKEYTRAAGDSSGAGSRRSTTISSRAAAFERVKTFSKTGSFTSVARSGFLPTPLPFDTTENPSDDAREERAEHFLRSIEQAGIEADAVADVPGGATRARAAAVFGGDASRPAPVYEDDATVPPLHATPRHAVKAGDPADVAAAASDTDDDSGSSSGRK